MLFLFLVLSLTTALLCYAGYVFLIVDKRQQKQIESNPDLFNKLDDKEYNFDLPAEVDSYEELSSSKQEDKRTLPMALLKRAMADIPRIEVARRPPRGTRPAARRRRPLTSMPVLAQQLEKDHPRMARLHTRGLLPFGLWDQLLEAEALMDSEVQEVQAEAEKLQKGWGQGVFGQAYQMLRQEREADAREKQMRKDMAVLTLTFTKPSGGVVTVVAEGRSVGQQTQLVLRKGSGAAEINYKCEVRRREGGSEGEGKWRGRLRPWRRPSRASPSRAPTRPLR
jgi:hypothetical protein